MRIPGTLVLLFTLPLSVGAEPGGPPVARWTFDKAELPTVADVTGSGYHGKVSTPEGAIPLKLVTGLRGQALQFTSNARPMAAVLVRKLGNLDFTKGFTFEAVVRMRKAAPREKTFEIITNTLSDRGKGVRFRVSWNSLGLRSGDGKKTWGISSKPAIHSMRRGHWQHFAGTYDPGKGIYQIYIGGKLAGEATALPPTKGRADCTIGSYVNGYAYGMMGDIDEIVVYDYPRRPIDIVKSARLR